MGTGEWQNQVKEYLEQGLFGDALICLESTLLDSETREEELDKLSQLIEISYTQSRQDKAFTYAQSLEAAYLIKNIPWVVGLLLLGSF